MYIHGNCAVGMWLKPKGKFNLIDKTMASHLGYGKGMTGARAEVRLKLSLAVTVFDAPVLATPFSLTPSVAFKLIPNFLQSYTVHVLHQTAL